MPAFRGKPPYLMTEMIAAEPAHAERLLHRLADDPAFDALADAVRASIDAGEPIFTTGCGTSEHAAMAIAALLTDALDRDARSVQALESLHRPPATGLLIAVSHEGGTHATNEALRAARDAGARTALVTAGAGSPGAALAEIVVTTGEQDQSWCHTIGYLSPMLVGVALARRLAGTRPDIAAIRALLSVTEDSRPAADVAAGLRDRDRLLVIGSGVDAITARELALKVAEGAHLPTSAHELETILHGHLAAADRWTGMVLIATESEPRIDERIDRALAAARTIGISAAAICSEEQDARIEATETPAGRIVLPHTGRVPGVAGSLLASAIALQLLTERLARARGFNPDTLGREDPAQATAHGG
jgi:glucosamine 6-phosphate synthetase-like amidotransferase/phosphosugar isomerase protein